MRCEQCGHPNPENHRFCGMCGARLVQKVSAVPIDDNDPLDLETPVYAFEDLSHPAAQSTADIRDRDRRRERMRDSAPTTRPVRSANNPSFTSVTSFPPDTVQEEVEAIEHHLKPETLQVFSRLVHFWRTHPKQLQAFLKHNKSK